MGGSIDLVKWLVDKQCCPISSKKDPKTGKFLAVKTSADRTVVDLAMTGKPKIEILMYLIRKGLSTSPQNAGSTLNGRFCSCGHQRDHRLCARTMRSSSVLHFMC